MRDLVKLALLSIVIVAISYTVMKSIVIHDNEIGLSIAEFWCKEVDLPWSANLCISILNSEHYVVIQSLSLLVFLIVVAMIVMHTEWRIAAAILGVVVLILVGVVNPRTFIESVSWNLILFLAGSMTFAGILRELGVFRYLAIQILRLSRLNIYILIGLISTISFTLSAVVGEVTSIIYVAMLVLEFKRLLKIDIEPLLILTVLATNTGSIALPIGNPIGIYLLFTSSMSISAFIKYSLPLALLSVLVLYGLYIATASKYLKECRKSLEGSRKNIEAYISSFYTEVYNAKAMKIFIGLILLAAFVSTISFNDIIASTLSLVLEADIDPHSFLTFIPYIYIVLSMVLIIPLEEVATLVQKAVDWPSILFFIMLFMLGSSLLYTGAMIKIAYIFATITTSEIVPEIIMVVSSAVLSAVLDNLSVVVAFTPIATAFIKTGLAGSSMYFALLFGGVFGGNYTPIGSTANIVALSLAEKRKIHISWRKWLSIALMMTTLQIVLSIIWIYMSSAYG